MSDPFTCIDFMALHYIKFYLYTTLVTQWCNRGAREKLYHKFVFRMLQGSTASASLRMSACLKAVKFCCLLFSVLSCGIFCDVTYLDNYNNRFVFKTNYISRLFYRRCELSTANRHIAAIVQCTSPVPLSFAGGAKGSCCFQELPRCPVAWGGGGVEPFSGSCTG